MKKTYRKPKMKPYNRADNQINCAECGKPMKYGESLTSQRIYDDAGLFGYAVCWDCHTSGLKERMDL